MKNLVIGASASIGVSMLAAILSTISPWFLSLWFCVLSVCTFFISATLASKAVQELLGNEDETKST